MWVNPGCQSFVLGCWFGGAYNWVVLTAPLKLSPYQQTIGMRQGPARCTGQAGAKRGVYIGAPRTLLDLDCHDTVRCPRRLIVAVEVEAVVQVVKVFIVWYWRRHGASLAEQSVICPSALIIGGRETSIIIIINEHQDNSVHI